MCDNARQAHRLYGAYRLNHVDFILSHTYDQVLFEVNENAKKQKERKKKQNRENNLLSKLKCTLQQVAARIDCEFLNQIII